MRRIAYLYSAPLIRFNDDGSAGTVDQLQVGREKRQIRHCVRQSGRNVEWREAVATISNFRDIVSHGKKLWKGGGGGLVPLGSSV